jgi:hypothetical protein
MRNLQKAAPVGPALLLLVLAVAQIRAIAQDPSVPQQINYQGKLTDAAGQPLPNGTYGVVFRIWSTPTGTASNSLVWAHDYDVPLAGGSFNVILGAGGGSSVAGAALTNIGGAFSQPDRFLGLTIVRNGAGQPIPNPQESSPRQRILSTPFALTAGNGLPIGGIMAWLPTNTFHSIQEVEALVPANFRLCKGPDAVDDPKTVFDETLIPNFMDENFVVGGPPELAGTNVGSSSHTHSYAVGTSSGDGSDSGSVNSPQTSFSSPHHTHLVSGTTEPAAAVPSYLSVLFIIRVN